MNAVVSALFALLLGTSIIVTASGLLGTALALGATELGFSSSITAAIMSSYFAGYVVGTYICPRIVRSAGHVRAFSAFAAVAASAVLLHPLLVAVPVWMLLRFVTGLCVVGLYMIIESWLNERSTNEARGRVFAVYQVISLLALAIGQYLILVGSHTLSNSFILAGALLSIGLVPVVLTRVAHPTPITTIKLRLDQLWQVSPLGLGGTAIAGLANGALFSLGPVFAHRIGLGTAGVAVFMSLALLGGVALQWPIGQLSDRWDRRRVILLTSTVSVIFAGAGSALVGRSLPGLLAAVFLYGGTAFALYPLCVAHSNDHIDQSDFMTTSGGLLLVYGIGAAVGPLLAGPLMQYTNAHVFLAFLAVIHAALSLFALIRMGVRAPPPVEEQESFVMLGRTSQTAFEMLATTDETDESDSALSGDDQVNPVSAAARPDSGKNDTTVTDEHP